MAKKRAKQKTLAKAKVNKNGIENGCIEKNKGEKAIRKMLVAHKRGQEAELLHDPILANEGRRIEQEAKELLAIGDIQRLSGNEATLAPMERQDSDLGYYRDTLSDPDLVNIEASCKRLHLLAPMNCLQMGADVAETINAKNSLEKMLAHQMAACHVLSMKFLSEARDQIDQLCPHHRSEIAAKLTNASARLMDTFQRGLATLTKIRTGGQQKMIVEHVHINEGGQAIVGNVNQREGGPQAQDGSGDKKQG